MKIFTSNISILLVAIGVSGQLAAQNKKVYKVFKSDRAEAWSPEKEMVGFELADGFVIELVASEKLGVVNPIDLTFDDHGRLWTQTARMYPLDPISGQGWNETLKLMKDESLLKKRMTKKQLENYNNIKSLYKLEKRGSDQILVMDKPTAAISEKTPPLKVWMDGLTIPQSIMPYKNGCYVAHGSEIFFLEDSDGDGKQDKHRTVMSGFGIFDTHTMAHSFVRGPGGWINFSHGALNSGMVNVLKSGKKFDVTYAKNLRMSLDEKDLEIIGVVRDNNWGYQVRSNGQWYNTSANDNGLSVLPMEDQWGISGIGGKKLRDYQPMIHSVHDFRVIGTGISGLAFSEDGSAGFPKEYVNVAFLANPITNAINCVKIHREPSGEIKAKILPNLLQLNKEGGDDWFRPVNIEFGPDGCLYIADWYNKIIGHNEVRTDHPDRDRSHGRIWRIRHKSQKPFSIADVGSADTSKLIGHLTKGKTIWEKRAAWHQIVDRKAINLIPQLKEIIKDKSTPKDVRILAMWSLEGLRQFDEALIKSLIASADGDVRREAIRSLATYKVSAAKVAELVRERINDKNVMVRSQVLRTLEEIKDANIDTIGLLVESCKPAAPNNKFGGNYERNFERFLARKALEGYSKELIAFLKSPKYKEYPSDNILWALQALPEKQKVALFIENWKSVSKDDIDKDTLISISWLLLHKEMKDAVAPTFAERADELLKLVLENYDLVNGPKIAEFYTGKINELLASEDKSTFSKGLEIVIKLRSPQHRPQLVQALKTNKHSSFNSKILEAILFGSPVSSEIYKSVLDDEKYDFNLRVSALAAYVIRDKKNRVKVSEQWVSQLSDSEKTQVTTRLSHTREGVQVLLNLCDKNIIKNDMFDYDSAYRLQELDRRNPKAKQIFQQAAKIEKTDRDSRKAKIKQLMKDLPKLKGNATTGSAVYQSCLTCHQANKQGFAVGPPIDGLGNRNLEGILTSIIDPEDSVAGAYALYTVVRKDGSVVEGMLAKKDDKGITVKMAAGAKVFIAKDQILADRSVNKRSFMWRTFNAFPDQTYADLLEYINQNLK